MRRPPLRSTATSRWLAFAGIPALALIGYWLLGRAVILPGWSTGVARSLAVLHAAAILLFVWRAAAARPRRTEKDLDLDLPRPVDRPAPPPAAVVHAVPEGRAVPVRADQDRTVEILSGHRTDRTAVEPPARRSEPDAPPPKLMYRNNAAKHHASPASRGIRRAGRPAVLPPQ
ncbi:hypothetical protein [Actinoplanes palleronii]|uniref:hypothetical protein n=1 Tax=Actinoplanes palleronii TaxID=113570 RepID=UPI001940E9D8|nr:hypothetical protein [Actinoplanes palleronii]